MKTRIIKLLNESEVVDRSVEYSIDDYSTAATEYLSLVNPEKNDIKSIYQVGSISVPGISDIDYILTFKDDTFDDLRKYRIEGLTSKSKYIFSHNGFYVNENVLKKIRLWFPFSDLNAVYGEEITPKYFNDRFLHLLLALQYIISKIPSDLIFYSTYNRRLHERVMLAMVYSLKHTVRLFKKAGIDCEKKWDNFIADYSHFRSSWFKSDSAKDPLLKGYIADGIVISYELIERLSDFLNKSLRIKSYQDYFEVNFNSRKLVFDSRWNKNNALNLYLESNPPAQSYPIEIGVYIYLWINSANAISKQLQKRISTSVNYDFGSDLQDKFKLHSDAIDEYYNFHIQKFRLPPNGYQALWAQYSSCALIRYWNGVYRRLLCIAPF